MHWHKAGRQGFRAGLLVIAASLPAPAGATAQGCTNNGIYSCVVPSGTYTSDIQFYAPTDQSGDASAMTVTARGTMNVPVNLGEALNLVASGNSPGGGTIGQWGGNGLSLTIANQGALTLTAPQGTVGSYIFGIYSALYGGNGAAASGTSNSDSGGNGGSSSYTNQQLSLTNSAPITINLPNVAVVSGAALYAITGGGQGGASNPFGGASGGSGGVSTGAVIVNTGAVNVSLAGSNGFGGIEAIGQGGNAGTGLGGAANGGAGGSSSVTNSAPVDVTWAWQNPGTPSYGLFGILAQSVGGNGSASASDGASGGTGGFGNTPTAFVTLNAGGNVSVAETGTPAGPGAGVAAQLIGGNGGGSSGVGQTAGNGGWAGTQGEITAGITVTNANVTTQGASLPGLLVSAQGGAGGDGGLDGTQNGNQDSGGGNGGFAGDSKIIVTASTGSVTISTAGSNSPAIIDLLQGGPGGVGGPYQTVLQDHDAGNGGGGGAAGAVTVNVTGQPGALVYLTTTGNSSAGISASSVGAVGGNGGMFQSSAGSGYGGTGGPGGHSWDVDITLTSTSVSTQGTSSPGIFALSAGAAGGAGGSTGGGLVSHGGNGGAGGYGRNVNVTLDSASSITTQGTDSSGIVAQSQSGAGGDAGAADGTIYSAGGNGGAGGSTGSISVTSNGSISTTGVTARGILAQAMSGAGGAGGSVYGLFYAGGGTGASTGSIGPIAVTVGGAITTAGANAEGVLAQSIAGGGGAGGQAGGPVAAVGGDASTNPLTADAGTVAVTLNAGGSVTTKGLSAVGILAQSIGGGGGDGGGASGAVSVGGSGGMGGAGAEVVGAVNSAQIATSGDVAHGIVMQSIGGGGGNAGNASGTGLFTSVAIGGSGGNGGSGGPVTLNMTGPTIATAGSKSGGIVAQSIGGGGGTGGEAFTGSLGIGFSAAVAVGGSGGTGGGGSQVSSQMVGGSIATGQNSLLVNGGTTSLGPCASLPCNLLPVDDYAVVIQSIGGGGGVGGSALATAVAIGVPVDETGNQIAVSTAVALGGKGGGGGSGNYVTFAVDQGGKIITSGQGSSGVLLQSIGGGGGAGGDSSALAATYEYGETVPAGASSLSLTVSFSVGGSGGGGGSGGPAYMALGGLISVENGSPVFTADPSGSPVSTITTYGDFADAIKAQSIGGGGGDAGIGSGNTQSFGSGTSVSLNVTLGSTGGSGGSGGPVIVQLFPTSAITTWGSNAIGVVAQSIGGGGGASQGGSYSFGGSQDNVQPKVTLQVGTQGGTGNTGGPVTVDVQAPIKTHGGDAQGVLAQSVGGGGGLGGSVGSDGSADNPIVEALDARQAVSNILNKSVSWDGTFTLAVGGTGGSGNSGGAVAVNLGSTIATSGDWASGIIAQSIGGGGGKGGTAAATGTGGLPQVTINLNMAVGGTGGQGGNGGPVAIGLTGSGITTAGYGAAGVIAQSIGGGGGMGADGSDGAWGLLAVGVAGGGSGGATGGGGDVTLTATNANVIKTTGEAADGVVLQSVGGGGGMAGAGSSFQLSVSREQTPATTLSAGGGAGSSGAGGAVTFAGQGSIAISTTGNNAFGILAQSVGGGGGIVAISQGESRLTNLQTSIGGNDSGSEPNNNGGVVTVSLNAGSAITTTGTGAHGIVAQSVGGGGGIVGLPGTAPVLTTTTPSGNPNAANGIGGNVTVNNAAVISVSGAGAIGILAQSIGSGGGLLVEADGNTVFAGSPAASLNNSGGHGSAVTVTASGAVTASGTNGIGIFAQSTGNIVSKNGPISVTVAAAVTGGSGQGSAVQIDSTAGNQGSSVSVSAAGSLQAASGTAVLASGGGSVNATNYGTITGSMLLNGGTFNNYGTYSAGAALRGDLVNSGLVEVAERSFLPLVGQVPSFATTAITGSFVQTRSGTLQVGVDFNTGLGDTLTVTGPVILDGAVKVLASSVLPRVQVPLVIAQGGITGQLAALSSPLFTYTTQQSATEVTITAQAISFAPPGLGVSGAAAQAADYLLAVFNTATSPELGYLFRELDDLAAAGGGAYANALTQLAPGTMLAFASRRLAETQAFADGLLDCPSFLGPSSVVTERGCAHMETVGQTAHQFGTGSFGGFTLNQVSWRMGGQAEVAPGWVVGGGFAYGQGWLTGTGNATGNNTTGFLGVSLLYQTGPWQAGLVAFGSVGSTNTIRVVAIPGFATNVVASPGVDSVGGRVRLAYTAAGGQFYVQPALNLDVIGVRSGSAREIGTGPLGLSMVAASQTSFAATPLVEVGMRSDLSPSSALRSFVSVGVTAPSNDRWQQTLRFEVASPDSASFTASLPMSGTSALVEAGVQLLSRGWVDLRATYDGAYSGRVVSHTGTVRAAFQF